MTFRGFILRLVFVALFTWIVGSIIESFAWGLYFALVPIFFHETLRPRPTTHALQNLPTTQQTMKPISLILIFAWISILGLSFTILSDFLWPILIAAVVFTLLVLMIVPKRG